MNANIEQKFDTALFDKEQLTAEEFMQANFGAQSFDDMNDEPSQIIMIDFV